MLHNWLVSVLALTALVCCVVAGDHLNVRVNPQTGLYTIFVDQTEWLHGGDLGVRNNGQWFTTTDASLILVSYKTGASRDILGAYKVISLEYRGIQPIVMIVRFKVYKYLDLIEFEQYFPHGANLTANGATDDLATCFPSFTDIKTKWNYLTYYNTFASPRLGKWNKPKYPGSSHGGVPLVLYDTNLDSLVISPLNNFMVGIQTTNSSAFINTLACGIVGTVAAIPVGFQHSTIVSYSRGLTSALTIWGAYLLKRTGKSSDPTTDTTTTRLGYFTDRVVLLLLHGTRKSSITSFLMIYLSELPRYNSRCVRFVFHRIPKEQFNSWWYYKGVNDGVKFWQPREEVFPNGLSYMSENMDYMPLVLHNRYFAPDTDYQKDFPFAIESEYALPLTTSFFYNILSDAQKSGMIVYEQDWLSTTFSNMEITQNNTNVARDWLIHMGKAARKLGIHIQYCMAFPNHLLQSTEIPSVTQARVTGDYQPGNDQWQVFYTNMLLGSLGIAPFKDCFWSTSEQLGCPYETCNEPNPILQTLVSALTAGPIAVADRINYTNASLVMHTSMYDGTLLRPNRPAYPLDMVFKQFPHQPIMLQIAETFCDVSGIVWHYIFAAADLPNGFTIFPENISLWANAYVSDYFTSPVSYFPFTHEHPLDIPPLIQTSKYVPFKFYVVSPVLDNGWTLLGDFTKFYTVAKQRISSIKLTATGLNVTVHGSPSTEAIEVMFITPNGQLLSANCTTNSAGECLLHCDKLAEMFMCTNYAR